MRFDGHGIFMKVLLYTMLLILMVIGVTSALFAQQVVSFYNTARIRQLSESFSELTEELSAAHRSEYAGIARNFSDRNQSYSFVMRDPWGRVVFASVNITDIMEHNQLYNIVLQVGDGFTLTASAPAFGGEDLSQLTDTIFLGSLVLIAICFVATVAFARQMTRPIKTLVDDAMLMSRLEPVTPPPARKDELGTLSEIVHEMYGKLKDTIADLEEEKEAQRYFFAAASHELKTPIAATGALLQGMLDDIGEYRDHPKYLWECLKLTNEQNKIITEILEIVKLTDGKIEPRLETVRIRGLAEDVLPRYQALIDKKELALELRIPEELTCVTDPAMLDRALSNVVINAVQNTPERGGIHIWTDNAGSSDEHIRLCVMNTGAHIDEDTLPKLFNPFFRVDTARTHGGRSGLGLTIVAKTLECMGLRFALENTGGGVLFWVELPVIAGPAAPPA
ncbi:MAG: HAMP domain-containing histidine kinase [Defluviitaleaceae bacterium]|nr:HAMP domain-containing histidine kinase [Defluviitaleaceae bacterium]